MGQDEGVRESGFDPGAAGNDRRLESASGAPASGNAEYEDSDDQPTTALRRPSAPRHVPGAPEQENPDRGTAPRVRYGPAEQEVRRPDREPSYPSPSVRPRSGSTPVGPSWANRQLSGPDAPDRRPANFRRSDDGGRDHREQDHRVHERREPDYREPGYREPDYQEPDYQEPDHREPEYRERAYREPDHREQDHRHPDRREQSYRQPVDREQGYREPGHPEQGYREPGHRESDYRESDPRESGRRSRDHGEPIPHERDGYDHHYPDLDDPSPRDMAGGYAGHGRPDLRPPLPRGSHLPPYSEPLPDRAVPSDATKPPYVQRRPRKLTVTRVAALRSRELTNRGVQIFHRAATADGADKSGLTHLTYAVMANYAVDAALAVALAGTLFFSAATAESTGRVLLYLVITVALFAVIAPFIGPMLDRLQSGRRLALAVTNFGRALLAILMAFNFSNFNPWVIYPCALGNLVLSKAFGVLKAALTPRVLPEQITLVKTNSRLATFGMIAGGVAGALAAGLSKIAGSPGALFFTAACAIGGGVLCLRIPAWVESTEGEVPVKHANTGAKKGFPQIVVATLWANSVIRVETGFLALFIAFVVKSQYPQPAHTAFTQLLLLGVIGAAAGIGGFVGNTMGARMNLAAPEKISLFSLVGVLVATVVAVLVPGLATAAVVGFVGSTASSLAKVSLDSVIQRYLPEASRASGFGRSESVLQLGWVLGGVTGLLLGGVWTFGHANVYIIGFATITVLLIVGLIQSVLVRSGRSMFPSLPARTKRSSAGRTGRRGRRSGDTGTLVIPPTETLERATPARPTIAGPAAHRLGTLPYGAGKPDDGPASSAPAPTRRRVRKAGKN